MARHTSTRLDDLSPATRRVMGTGMVALGVLLAWLIHQHPEGLRVPAWVAYLACLCFSVAGLAVALHASISRQFYGWMMVLLLGLMTLIPAWIAFGPGTRACRASQGFLPVGESACRLGFGVGSVIMVLILIIAIRIAIGVTNRGKEGD